ncbi:MAG: class I SAM-dependent methyltransferase [Chloroflexi bacterium]|nr:class I SAM-dependent methyltransferase [Chloroflexota bacterium]
MTVDDRFEGLLDDLSGFYRSWLIYLGLELELIAALHRAAGTGRTVEELAGDVGCASGPVDGWCRAAYAYGLVELVGRGEPAPRFRVETELASVLLDERLPEYLGGQFVFSVGASLDHGRMLEFFRSGEPEGARSPRFHRAVEKLNAQDTVLFMDQALVHLDAAARALGDGGAALDVACGGAGWLVTMARAFPRASLTGIEFEPDWLERARSRVRAAGFDGRITIESRDPVRLEWADRFDLVYLQDVLHELPDPVDTLRGAAKALRAGGTLAVLDWCMPEEIEDYRSPHGELLWGYQLDELYQGTSLLTREGFRRLFAEAGLSDPRLIELEAGATLFVVRRGD